MTAYVTAWLWLITSVFQWQDQVELVCMRRQMAANACHYNFLINGMPYRYVDNGCRENRDTVMKKARQGKLALAKDWKIDCPPGKDN
jgi:hypothetical protein